MDISLRPKIVRLLKNRSNVEDFVNQIVYAYLNRQFIRKSEVAGTIALDKVYRKNIDFAQQEYDLISGVFKGVRIDGQRPSDSLFIADQKLHDLLQENRVLLVMKTARTKRLPSLPSDKILIKIAKEDMS